MTQEYWEKEWQDRTSAEDHKVLKCNVRKAQYLINELWMRTNYIGMKTLEIGCGASMHVIALSKANTAWKDQYTGIDLSKAGPQRAREFGLRSYTGDILNGSHPNVKGPFQLFLFLDVLEHIEDHDKMADKVKEIGDQKGYYMFANVPLYRSPHEELGGFERDINIDIMKEFSERAGMPLCRKKIYGISGWPYMIFEAKTK